MSILQPTLLSLARAAAVALVTLAVLISAGPGTGSMPRRMRTLLLWLSLPVLLMPGFAVGFAYFDCAMKQDAIGREVIHCLLTWLRVSPLAMPVIWLMPPALSDTAMHCLRLGTSSGWWQRLKRELRAWGRSLWLGVALVFLLSFQEFEIATTWNLRAWPVALFDAQAGGFPLTKSLRLALLPFLIQAALIATLAVAIRPRMQTCEQGRTHSLRSLLVILAPAAGVLCICLVPAMSVAGRASTLFWSTQVKALELAPSREIWNGIGIAASATVLAWTFAGWISTRPRTRWLFALPGLFGPMLCGLTILALLRLPPFHLLRDTIFPAVIGLAAVLLPLALLLSLARRSAGNNEALQIARASDARRPLWQLDGRPRLIAAVMLFCSGYGDFTINSLLAPPQFTSASVRLLNLLHYGRSDMLVMMFAMAFAIPFIVVLLTMAATRFYPHRRAT